MEKIEIRKSFSNSRTRQEIRMRVVNELALEIPGKGKGLLASRYIYYVEQLKDGNEIYLRRPARFYNGFDFLVCISNYNFAPRGSRKRNFPKHEDIIRDLKQKKSSDPQAYKRLYSLIQKTYNCQEIPDECEKINFSVGFSAEMLLKTLKWLFIEQDIRYWNYSGRDMLFSSLPKP